MNTSRILNLGVIAFVSATLISLAGCGGGGSGGGSASTPPAQPAYVNGTTTGQFTNNDVGFYLGALTNPATVTSSTPSPTLKFDIGNGFSTTLALVKYRVLKDGAPFNSGEVTNMGGFSFSNIEIAITPGSGSHVYRIELDYDHAISETNENNNFVELAVTVAFSG